MDLAIKQIVKFHLTGKFGHFRKFYTNSSSLSYLIPPKTALCGLFASILKIPRDNYYDLFSNSNVKISCAISKNAGLKKITQSVNYLHSKYFNLLIGRSGKIQHSQCKFELLSGNRNKSITYIVYLAILVEKPEFSQLINKMKEGDVGYGIYFGQRPFKANITNVMVYRKNTLKILPQSDKLDSVCNEDNIVNIDFLGSNMIVQKEKMPCEFKIDNQGREIVRTKNIYFERNGCRITGSFNNVVQLKDKYISFY
ncbi:MAG: CRISPR-associated protein Cas5 [Atribacterota bacterium]